MKVFFTASFREKEKYQDAYDTILEAIESTGADIISLERQDYSYLIPKKIIKTLPQNQLHYAWIKKGIKKANCVVIETSRDSFRLGHEATLALLYNKPVLCLSDKKDYGSAIIDPLFYANMYKEKEEAFKYVVNFMDIVKSKHMSLRKNIYITSDYANFLNWYASKNNKNDSEVIRDMIKNLKDSHSEYENSDLRDLSSLNNNDD